MDNKLVKLINTARMNPEGFTAMIESIEFKENSTVINAKEWATTLTRDSITAITPYLVRSVPAFNFSHFKSSPYTLFLTKDEHPLLMSIHILLLAKSVIFDPSLDQISLSISKAGNNTTIKVSLRQSPSKTLTSTQTMKAFLDKSRKVARDILSDPVQTKRFKKMMVEGSEWITELAKQYGPFTGYELNEFISWFRAGDKQGVKTKPKPRAYEPKGTVLPEKIVVNEAGIAPEGNVAIQKLGESKTWVHPIDMNTNSFCQKTGENVRFTFKAKQRYKDLQEVLKQTNGNVDDSLLKTLPERDPEEIAKDPPISVPEKYEAFLIEEVLIPSPATVSIPSTKPSFNTNFRLPDNLKIKTETAKQMLQSKDIIIEEPYVHKFRDEFDPKVAGKQDFVLRLPKPKMEKYEKISEPMEKIKLKNREEKKKMEEEEKRKRTELYGKIRGEWVYGFKPVTGFYELGTGKPHKLLDKEGYVESFKISSRAS